MPRTNPESPRTRALYHAAIAPGAATLAVAFGVATFYLTAAAQRPGLAQLVVAQLVLGGAALVAAAATPAAAPSWAAVRDRLALHAPSWRAAAGAALVGATAWLPNLALTLWLSRLWNGPVHARGIERLLASTPWTTVLVLATVPALCEELLFRGVWSRALATRVGVVGAAIITGIGFGAYHLSLAQLVPATLLGTLLAWASLRSGSLWTAVILHATNNAIAGAVGAGLVGPIATLTIMYPRTSIVLAVCTTAAGCALLSREAK